MPTTKTITLYTFDELSDTAKEKARDWYKEDGLGYEWWDSVYEDAKTVAALMGISVTQFYFSGFWSQGDGACFEGNYEYALASVAAVKEYAPKDEELHRIATQLALLQQKNFYKLSATVKHSGRGYHDQCTAIDVRKNGEYFFDTDDSYVRDTDHDGARLIIVLRDFMKWFYKQLQNDYEYQNSDEVIDETMRANEYTFTESGKRED